MAVTFFSCFNDFGCGDIFHALRFQKCVCGSRGITVTKSFRFHFSGHQRLTIFVFELQSDGEGAKSFIVSAIIQPELVSTNISREPYRICIVIQLAIPADTTKTQWAEINRAIEYGKSQGVKVTVTQVK